MTETEKNAQPESPYMLYGIIHVPGYPEEAEKIGYYLKENSTHSVEGFSKQEAWQLLSEKGAVNAEAATDEEGNQIIKTEKGMLPIHDESWKIPAWKESGELAAPLSEEAWQSLERGLEAASQNLAQEVTANISFETEVDEQDLYAVKEAIDRSGKIAVLTGAGVSTMSGIPDYRSVAMGMWEKDPQLLEYLNESAFQQDPALFWENFYQLIKNTLRPLLPFSNHTNLLAAMRAIRPNQTHQFFSWLEMEKQKKTVIVTQNVDRLHQKSGSEQVIEFHGNVLTCTCRNCGRVYQLADVLKEEKKPECVVCGGDLRPNAVFFGDPVNGIDESIQAVESADLVIVAGTSMQVFPFSSLIGHVSPDKKLIYMNGDEPDEPALFDHVLTGNLSEISEKLKRILQT